MDWHEYPHAPTTGSVICPLGAIPDRGCREFCFGTGESRLCLILYRNGRNIRAYVNSCPHFSLPLNAHGAEFLLLPQERIMCAWHCSVFLLQDGTCEDGPSKGVGLEAVPVSVIDGNVVVAHWED